MKGNLSVFDFENNQYLFNEEALRPFEVSEAAVKAYQKLVLSDVASDFIDLFKVKSKQPDPKKNIQMTELWN